MTASFAPASLPRRRSRSLAEDVVTDLGAQIRNGTFPPGSKLPTETQIMQHYDVSRTVVREAISRLQAAGIAHTRHGIGTFVLGNEENASFRIDPDAMLMIRELLAALEMRTSLEADAAGLAATRRTAKDLEGMRRTLDEFREGIELGHNTVPQDIQFHRQIALATANHYFADMLNHLGNMVMPRARLDSAKLGKEDSTQYLLKISGEHESIYDAIARGDPQVAQAAMRLHLGNSRERLRKAHNLAQPSNDDPLLA